MTIQWLLSWWNLIFIVPFGLALMYLGVYTLSGWTFGDADFDHDMDMDHDIDVDHDVEIDHDVDVDHDIDADHDVDADHDADTDHDADGEQESESGPGLWTVLSFLGVGRVPLSIILMVLLLTWGFIGFFSNQMLRKVIPDPTVMALISLAITTIGSFTATSVVSRGIIRWLPLHETFGKRRHELLGSVGEAIYPINKKFGMASVRDERGDLFQVPCRLQIGDDPVPKGARVQLVAYNANEHLYYVIPGDHRQN